MTDELRRARANTGLENEPEEITDAFLFKLLEAGVVRDGSKFIDEVCNLVEGYLFVDPIPLAEAIIRAAASLQEAK